MQVNLYQGSQTPPADADITIVIDVIRAFTVSFYAFQQGVDRILLVESVEHALKIRQENPDYLLAGEINGYPIDGFDYGNSPYQIKDQELTSRTLVQKTTNGVRATLNCLASEHLFVTGFASARTTALYVRNQFTGMNGRPVINIVASHPTGDDDYVCAAYIKSILEGAKNISVFEVTERIKKSDAAQKFFDETKPVFNREDIFFCAEERPSDFVMRVNKTGKTPMIERIMV